jgi:3-oxoacyl-[acyl-carrier protein] reductase
VSVQLDGSKALVTGGSEGIGRGIAAALVAKGCAVTITGRSAEPLRAAAAELGCEAFQGDVGVEADAVRCVAEFVARHGRIDILVNNAGFGRFAPLVDMTLDDLEAVYRTNVFGAFLMAREAARHFVRQRSGNLINIASTAGLKAGAGGTAYASSKFALRGMTEAWRDELRRHDVRVMLVNPSEVQTAFFGKVGRRQEPSEKKLRPEEIAAAIVGILEIDDRGFVPELSVFATNPF